MMWLTMLFCALPLVILLLSGSAGGYSWFVIAGIAAFAAGHFWLMRKGHGGHTHSDDNKNNSHMAEVTGKDANGQSREKEHCCH